MRLVETGKVSSVSQFSGSIHYPAIQQVTWQRAVYTQSFKHAVVVLPKHGSDINEKLQTSQ